MWNAGGVAMDAYTEVLSIFERHYPEMLSLTYIINGTMIVSVLYIMFFCECVCCVYLD